MKDAKESQTRYKSWKVLGKLKNTKFATQGGILKVLLENRGIKSEKAKNIFFDPIKPDKISLKSLGIKETQVKKLINRLKVANKEREKIIIYGDYDADGICATAILWECLYAKGLDVLPYIPERFSEGYGLNAESIKKIKLQNPNVKLIITVDNGIVANEAVNAANKLGIDIIVTDHHQKGRKLPKAHSIVHTDKICGSGIAWIIAREVKNKLRNGKTEKLRDSLELAAIGTIADQMPLTYANRSFAKFGLEKLRETSRVGLVALFRESAIAKEATGWRVGTYEVNYIIAPRLNAMGRMEHAIESLRLLCTTSGSKAETLAQKIGSTNSKRQRVLDEVVLLAKEEAKKGKFENVIVIASESYHEGVIGLAAGKLVEEFYRPAVVISKGEKYSKASARSISGFNMIEAIKELDDLLEGGGGHPMAAGFTIETEKIELFIERFEKVAKPKLTDEVLSKKLNIDLIVGFEDLNDSLYQTIAKFEPTGLGNPAPSFLTSKVEILDVRAVGKSGPHIKLKLKKSDKVFDAIGFGFGDMYQRLAPGVRIDVVYNLEKNIWNGYENLQLKIKDLRKVS